MANPNRKMATLRTIDALTPIADADRIELAHIGGWNVVVGKGEYAPGDTIVYFEIDTFFPEGDKRYAFLTNRGVKTMIVENPDGTTTELHGYVLKTAKLRKQVSQGLVLSPQECGIDDIARYGDVAKHPDVSAECGVREYVAPMPVGSYGIVGRFDNRIANRTDAERIQNVSEKAWQAMKQVPFHATVKVDGTSTTLCYDVAGTPHVFGHNYELGIEDGMIGAEILAAYEMSGIAQWCREHPNCAVQGEFVGPKLNGNRLNLTTRRILAFAVWTRDSDGGRRRKTDAYDIGFAQRFAESFVPTPNGPDGKPLTSLDWFDTPADLIEFVSRTARGYVTKGRLDEGVVLHYEDDGSADAATLHDEIGVNMEVKVISNRYLLKEK
jgi:RNA ligase (TIGR02306 family)